MSANARRTLSYVLGARARLELEVDAARLALYETSTAAFELLKRHPADHSVSCREFASFLVSAGQFPRPVDVFRLFRRYDRQRRGAVDLDAFRDALRPLQHKYSKANNVTLGVNATVENSCCRLSARKLLTELFVAEIEVEAEWNSCLCRLVANPRARGCFREIDVDDDGKISSDDLDRFMRRQCGVPFGVEAARALLRCADRDQDGVIGLLDWMDLLTPVELSERNGLYSALTLPSPSASFETHPFGFNTFVAGPPDPSPSPPFASYEETSFPKTIKNCSGARRIQPRSASVVDARGLPDYDQCKPLSSRSLSAKTTSERQTRISESPSSNSSSPHSASVDTAIHYTSAGERPSFGEVPVPLRHLQSTNVYCSRPFANAKSTDQKLSSPLSTSSGRDTRALPLSPSPSVASVVRPPTERVEDHQQSVNASAEDLERRRDSSAEGLRAVASTKNIAAPDVGIANIRIANDNEVALLNVFKVQLRLQLHADEAKQRLATEAGVDAFSAFFTLAVGRPNHEKIDDEQLMQFLKSFGISCSLEELRLWIRRHSLGSDDGLDLQRFRDAVAPAGDVVQSIVDNDAAVLSEEQERALAETLSHLIGVEIAHERVKMAFSERADIDYLRLFGRMDTHDCGRVTCTELRKYFCLFGGGERRNDVELLLRRYCRTPPHDAERQSFGFADFIRELAPN